ncbi:hypothetical protein Q31a_39060 [Aureliella helgolandensis]|uniref:Uncharacterized protein n=1 Tax=Aureliella helgolandensis TaxID=2527968 RepID=A0A518GAH1_9BACT|nr:hypothetical protein Q31a_39060 [Aureliella helgolandensis]
MCVFAAPAVQERMLLVNPLPLRNFAAGVGKESGRRVCSFASGPIAAWRATLRRREGCYMRTRALSVKAPKVDAIKDPMQKTKLRFGPS